MEGNRRIRIGFSVDDKELSKLMNSMQKIERRTTQLASKINAVSTGFNSLSSSIKKMEHSQKNYSKTMDRISEKNREATKSVKSFQKAVNSGFNSRIIDRTAGSVGRVDNRIRGARASMKGLNKYTLSWNEAMGISALRMVQWSVAGTAIFGTQRAFREMINVIIEVDTQMTELKKVMNEETNFDNMLESSIQLATTLGRTVTDINEAFIEFGRQGLSEEQVELMARATTLMANVGDIDAGTSANKLTGIITVFKKDFSEATDIVDRFNEVQNNYATTVQILTDSVGRAGGTANAFGVTLEELIGHTTAIGEATRESGTVIGNGLKTIYSRITTLKPAIDQLEGVGVQVFDPMTGSVRRVNDILGDLSGKWDTLSDSQKQNIGVQVAGRYQLTRFLALMDNYETALEATDTSTRSWGSAMKENQTYMQSLQAKINTFYASLQELAIALGESGVAKAFGVLVEAGTKLINGVTGLVEKFGAFTFAIPAITGGISAIAFQFTRLKAQTDVLKAGLVTVNPMLTSLGTRMGLSTGTSVALAGAIGKVTTSVKALAISTVSNPLFWIPLAVSAIIGLVGHFEQLEKRQEELIKTTKTAKEEYDDFLKSINDGKVDTYQVEKYKKQIEEMKEAQKTLNETIQKNSESLRNNSNQYSVVGFNAENLTKTKEELVKEYEESTKAMKELNDEQKNLLAQMGISITKETTMKDLKSQITEKEKEYTKAIKDAEKALKEQREKAVLPTAEAYFELGEAIDDQSSAMENAIGITGKFMGQMKEQRALIELLSGVKNKDTVQTQLLDNAYKFWSDTLGVNEEKLKKNPKLIDNQIKKNEELMDITKKMADGTATEEEKRRAQNLLSAENQEKAKKREQKAIEITKEAQRKAYEAKMKKLYEYDERQSSSSANTEKVVRQETNTVLDKHKEQRNSVFDTGSSYKKLRDMIDNSSSNASKSVSSMKESTNKSLSEVENKTGDTKTAWEKLRESLSKKITGLATISIKGIFSGLFGSGGNIDGDKLKDAVMSSGGGSISGKGFGSLRFTSGYGTRVHPISGKKSFHAGIDLAGPMGTPIRARHGGVVAYSGRMGGYGNIVIIRGSNGLEYRYAHNSRNYVQTGQFVPAGQVISAMGSTGDSTGSHLHFEVRRNGTAINPTSYYHSGGIVDKKPRHNEVDARLQVGEMVINQNQQKALFDFLNKKNANDTFTGQGGPTHTVRYGDTLSEIAMKYIGNAYSGGLKKLLKLNPQIKNPDRIYVGQKINLPGSNSTSKPKPKPLFKNKDEAQNYLSGGLAWIDQVEALGIRNSDYRVRNLTSSKYRKAYEMTGKKYEYNKMVFDELSKFTNANKAKGIFNKANLFLNSADKAKALKNVLENIGQNVLKEVNDKTNAWLDKFNKGIKEASASVKEMINISEQVNNRKSEEKKDNFVSQYTSDLLSRLGITEEVDHYEALQRQADELRRKIEQRAEETALLEYRLSSKQLEPRLQELAGYKSKIEFQMKAIENDFKSRGITNKTLIGQAQQPLKDRLSEITAEYNELQNAIQNGSQTLAENKAELEGLAEEYKKLQEELKKTDNKREFTDVWGNIVRDAEGNMKMITDQGQLIMNAYEQIRQEMEAVQRIATSGGSLPSVVAPIIEQLAKTVEAYKPTINTEVDPGTAIVNNENTSTSETKTYEANTNVNRNVTYVVQTGMLLATRSEMKELAMYIKEMIEEEDNRSRS